MRKETLFILGASDPEMAAIERLLATTPYRVAYAVDATGERVHPGNAYRAVGYCHVGDTETRELFTRWEGSVQLIECGGDLPPQAMSCDHHRPGDTGYGMAPFGFMGASSIGQVIRLLTELRTLPWATHRHRGACDAQCGEMFCIVSDGWYVAHGGGLVSPIPAEIVLTAAADHCLAAAYQGECPGVDPDELMRWRAESRAKFQKRTVAEVLADVDAARKMLRDALVAHGWHKHADMRGKTIPELPEAACREGIPFLADVVERDGRRKVVLQAAVPALVDEFMSGALVPGLTDIYGDPTRGFAGGYVNAAR